MAYGAQKDKELPRFLGALGNFLFFRAQLDRRIPHDRLLTGEGSHLSSPYQIIDTPILSTLYYPLSKCSVSELMLRLCCLLQTVELGICESPLTGLKLGQQCGQFGTVKLPLKRRRVLIGKLFIQGQPEPDGFQVGKIIGRQHLPLDDREVDFHLIEPTGVDRRMDQNDPSIDLTQPLL